jgi:hypothetical protein
MSAFAEIFNTTSDFLRLKGITPQITKGRAASPAELEQFRKKTGVVLPESFARFFTEYANGFEFCWQKSDEIWGSVSIPGLKQLAKRQLDWVGNVRGFLEDPNSLDECIDSPYRDQAFEIWRNMKSWIPFWDEGNGDHFCVDASDGRIRYDQHDWFDGFGSLAKTNGIIAGVSLEAFLQNWSRFCFCRNKSLWWGEFAAFGAIQWKPEFFDSEYYRGV